jgi:hypothetical protein
MAVDVVANFKGHNVKHKVGLITAASIEGSDIQISGFLYGADFPEEVAFIQANKDDLGFSYETQHTLIANKNADPLTVESLVFTGAAILLKKDAAYITTSLNASLEEIEMNEELKAVLDALQLSIKAQGEQIAALAKQQTEAFNAGTLQAASVHNLVKPHADKIRAAASSLCAAGMGMHDKAGHVALLNQMADRMEAEAHMGKLPAVYEGMGSYYAQAELIAGRALEPVVDPKVKEQMEALQASNKKLGEDLAALTAAAGKKDPKDEPQRRSFSPAVTQLLSRVGVTLEAGKEQTYSIAQIDELLDKAGIKDTQARMAAKLNLREAGFFKKAA